MKINNVEVTSKVNKVAFDGCHKIYIIDKEKDLQEALETHYAIYDLSKLPALWKKSCELRFIRSWDLKKLYVPQGEQATFELNVSERE